MTTTKATRATITLGDIELDVFQLPDGSYRYSYELLAEILERDKSILSDKKSPYNIKKLTGNQETNLKVKLDGIGYSYSTISQKDLSQALLSLTKLGCVKAYAYVEAAFQETLESRADKAFNVIKTEEEQNSKLAKRVKNVVVRRLLTDSIRDYTIKHESSETYTKFIYSNCSEHLNKIILGAKAKQAKEFYELPQHSLLRNHIPVKALIELELVEGFASRLIDERDIEPLEAVKQACVMCFAKTIGLE
jgi:hypothetical protein